MSTRSGGETGLRRRSLLATVCVATFLSALSPLDAAARQTLRDHVPPAVRDSQVLGRVSNWTTLQLAIGLPLRNQDQLDTLLQQIGDPSSGNYHQYLTPQEFALRFGPTESDYQAVIDFVQSNGLTVTATHPNRLILDVAGPVAVIERALHVNMTMYRHPARGTFYAPDRDPSIDLDTPVQDISGLDNFVLPHPMNLKTIPMAQGTPFVTGSGPAGLFIGNDFRAAYTPSVTLTGAGQAVGLLELDGFYASDVQANFKQAGLPAVPTQTVLLDGFSGAPGSSNIEVTLDIMMAAYMAPGLSKVIVYEGVNPNDILNRMATDDLAAQLSSSWGYWPINTTTEQIYKQFIAQGQSFFQASGDSGAYKGPIMPPSDDPNLTIVGGTSLTTAGPGGAWQAETSWPGSGGGISTTYAIPSYQQGLSMAANGGSTTMRNIPDVALTADIQMFLIQNNGQAVAVGGTSAAAPLWAGFIALANQQAAANKKPPVGFLNPLVYSIGKGSNFPNELHDIVTGNNSGFSAVTGYDLVTGWGSPSGQRLINDLTGQASAPSFSLSASPSAVSVKLGASGASTITVSPQNGFIGSVNLSVSGLPGGVTASFNPTSTSGASTLTLTAASSAAPATAALVVTGVSGTLTSTTSINLTVNSSAPNFALSASPSSLTVKQGASGTSAITIAPQNGFSSSVNLTVSGLPSGVTAAFNPASATGTSTLTFTASNSASAGVTTVTVTGASGSLSHSATIALTVTANASFTLSATPATLSVKQGSSGASTITAVGHNGFSGNISLAVTGVPPGVTATFSPSSTPGSIVLNLAASASAAVGSSTVTITGTSGTLSTTATISLTVTGTPNYSLSAGPTSLTLKQGTSGASTITVTPQNGFNGSVSLAVSGLPSGVTASFNPASTATTSTLTFKVSATAAPGTSTITVTGVSGTLSHTATINLTVQAQGFGTGVDLSSAYNLTGAVTDGSTFTNGGLDGGGRAYSANLLGSSQTVGAVTSKTIALPQAHYSTLTLLATAVNGNQSSQTFTVTYSDGTTSKFTQSLSDWFMPQNFAGESKAVTMAYRDNSDGTRDGRTFQLYSYSVNLNSNKAAIGITLPTNRNVVVLGIQPH